MHVSDSASTPLVLPRPYLGTVSSTASSARPQDTYSASTPGQPASNKLPEAASPAPASVKPASAEAVGSKPAPSEASGSPGGSDAVGSQRDFWAWDFSVMPPVSKPVHATLRSVGDHALIWVADEAWNQTVSEADVQLLATRFNQQGTPGAADPTQGIFATDVRYFGGLPHGIDQDTRATILLLPFANFQNTGLDGYFNAFDQIPDSEAQSQGQRSNEKNIIYLNTAGTPVASDYMQGVLAHEFSHLLQFGRNPEQDGWLGEMLAEAAMTANGYHTDFGHVTRHQAHPDRPLESPTYVDYGAGYLMGTYLLEHYGQSFVHDLAGRTGSGREALTAALQQADRGTTYNQLIQDWAISNYADSRPILAPGHNYGTLDPAAPAVTSLTTQASQMQGKLPPTGVAYLRNDFGAPCGFNVEVAASGKPEDGSVAAQASLLTEVEGKLHVEPLEVGKRSVIPAGGIVVLVSTGTAALDYHAEAVA